MARLIRYRKWALIMALGIGLACSALVRHDAYADPSQDYTGDSNGGGTPWGVGDPDVPDGPGKNIKAGAMTRGRGSFASGAAGDGIGARDSMMWRFYVVWLSLRSVYFRS